MPEVAVRRPVLSRQVTIPGPRFYRDGSHLMFVHNYDSCTSDGPRQATDEDKAAHPEAYEAHLADLHAPSPFKRILTAEDPEDGRPARERGPHERRREATRERGEE